MDNSASSATTNGMAVLIYKKAFIENCLISGHPRGGLQLWSQSTQTVVSSCTIASNATFGLHNNIAADCTNAVTNCIIYANGTMDITNTVAASTNYYWYCCASTPLPASQGNIASDPQLVGTLTNGFRLAAGSPCINRGINLPWMINDLDLDGKKRIMNKKVDIGAYEAWPPSGAVFSFH